MDYGFDYMICKEISKPKALQHGRLWGLILYLSQSPLPKKEGCRQTSCDN